MRENGYYWARIEEYWSIEYWNGSVWVFDGYQTSDADSLFDEIDENRIERL